MDLEALERALAAAGSFAVTQRAPGTLNGVFSRTRLQFLHADETQPQRLLQEPTVVAGVRIAGLPDLMATKLKVVAQRGEHRDYFDLQQIEQRARLSVEEGINYFLARFEPRDPDDAVGAIVRALGYMDDVDDDEQIPIRKDEVARYWRRRQPDVLKSVGRLG